MIRYKALRVGPLPVDLINRVLRTELESGDLWVSKAAHEHIAKDHPDDYSIIVPALSEHIRRPQYIGIDIRHRENFYMIRRVSSTDPVAALIAVGFAQTEYGTYNLRSAYRISQEDVDRRREKRLLHIVSAHI